MTEWTKLNAAITEWFTVVQQKLSTNEQKPLEIKQKSDRTDLVTNVDQEIEAYFVKQIKTTFPNSKILGEEGDKDQGLTTYSGLVWVIDPIDGTMNYIKQGDHFASMLAVYENGHEKLGYILDVTANKLYWGGPECGVYCNAEKLTPPADLPLSEGLLDISGRMLVEDYCHVKKAVKASLGIRVYGSAGIGFIHVLTGKTLGYLSHLHPWDYAAGKILAHVQGLVVETIDGRPFDMLSSNDVLVATKNAEKDILKQLDRPNVWNCGD